MFKWQNTLWVAALLLFSVRPCPAQEIFTLEQYLGQVKTLNPEIRSLDLSVLSMEEKVLELDMVYSPFLTGNYAYEDDKSGPGFGSSLPTEEMKANVWTVAASKKFSTGTNLSLGYTNSSASFDLLYPTAVFGPVPVTQFNGYQLQSFVKVEQSLLRDFLYGVTQSGIDKTKATVRAGEYLQVFRRQQILLQAQMMYWQLALAQEVLSFRKLSLDRTEKLLQWNQNRVGLDLADQADLYQAQAAYKARQLNYLQAQEDLIKTRRDFNEFIGNSSDAVASVLEPLSAKIDKYANVPYLLRSGERADVLAARASYRSADLANNETFYRSLPELSLAASYSLNGLDLTSQAAWDQISQSKKPTYALSLTCLVPLDFWTLAKIRDGYSKDYASAKEQLGKAELSAQNNWGDLAQNWVDVKSRLNLAQEVKSIQEKRLVNEQKRFQRGRSTTFQVITAENDLDDATLNVYRMVFEELVTAAQAELFNTQPLP